MIFKKDTTLPLLKLEELKRRTDGSQAFSKKSMKSLFCKGSVLGQISTLSTIRKKKNSLPLTHPEMRSADNGSHA